MTADFQPGDLKSRLAGAAERTGKTAQSLLPEAIGEAERLEELTWRVWKSHQLFLTPLNNRQ